MIKKFRITFITKYGVKDVFVTDARTKEDAIEDMRIRYIGPIGEIFRTATITNVEEL